MIATFTSLLAQDCDRDLCDSWSGSKGIFKICFNSFYPLFYCSICHADHKHDFVVKFLLKIDLPGGRESRSLLHIFRYAGFFAKNGSIYKRCPNISWSIYEEIVWILPLTVNNESIFRQR